MAKRNSSPPNIKSSDKGRSKFIKGRSKKAGLPPGTLVHVGTSTRLAGSSISVIEFDSSRLEEHPDVSQAECIVRPAPPAVSWVNVDGIGNIEALQKLGECFAIHSLVLEDVLNTDQRPKAEDYGKYLYVVLKSLSLDPDDGVIAEQVSIILGENYAISIQEGIGDDLFTPVRARLKNENGRLRTLGPDYLAYALLDVIVDNYFTVLEKLAEQIENIEEELVTNPTQATMHNIYRLKREMLFLHKAIWPLREVIGALLRRETVLIKDSTGIYLRDLYDHAIQVIDTLETLRDMLSGMLDIYLSSVSNRMNAVMKVLTIIATIFMPLTFIAGLYGMNFKYMPELEWHWGYPTVLVVMVGIVVAMLVYFRKKEWL